jgi:hypothetical protein
LYLLLPGIGKSMVAVEYAHRYAREFASVLWFSADSRSQLIAEFAEAGVDVGLVDAKKGFKAENVVSLGSITRNYVNHTCFTFVIKHSLFHFFLPLFHFFSFLPFIRCN